MNKIAFIFPGQGSQYVGMGKDFAASHADAKSIYSEASDVMGYDMLKLCAQGPPADLLRTEKAQPAILTTSIAMLKVLEKTGFNCDIVAGLSLGEYTALVKAAALSFREALFIAERRGLYMEEAVPYGIGCMAAIIGLEVETIRECMDEASGYGLVEIANYNTHYQVIISGEKLAVKQAIEIARERGAKKALLLPVKHPFHSIMMKDASLKLKEELGKVEINNLKIPLVANCDARIILKSHEVVPALIKQMSCSVLWHDSVKLMLAEGFNIFVEIGPGDVLSKFVISIAERENYQVNVLNVENIESYNKTLTLLDQIMLA